MQILRWLQTRSDPTRTALILWMLNFGMALACVITFFGVLAITGFLSWWLSGASGKFMLPLAGGRRHSVAGPDGGGDAPR